MMFTVPMRLLMAVVLRQDSERIAKALLNLGAMDLVHVKELSGNWGAKLASDEPSQNITRLAELRKRAENYMTMGLIKIPEIPAENDIAPVDIDAAAKQLDTISSNINSTREKQKSINDEILKLEEMRKQVEAFGELKTTAVSSYSFLDIRAGMMQENKIDELKLAIQHLPSVLLPSETAENTSHSCVLISLKKDAQSIARVLEQVSWQEVHLTESLSSTNALGEIDIKLKDMRDKQKTYSTELSNYFAKEADSIKKLWMELRSEELVAKLRTSFSKTEMTVLFSGWIPEEKVKAVELAIKNSTTGACSIEWSLPKQGEAKELDVPVEIRAPKVLKPFEWLVLNYAVPEYGTVNPTPFVAVAYLAMFGLMFGDVGHGFVIMLAGIIGLLAAKKKGSKDTLFRLATYCGISAMVVGAMFGSYFGLPWFPPLWFDYHSVVNGHNVAGSVKSITDILGITLKFGILVLCTGFILNWINLIRKKQWFHLLLDKAGILGAWIYIAGTWTAFYYVNHNYKAFPPMSTIFYILGLPTLLLVLKVPVEFFIHAKRGGKKFKLAMIADFLIGGLVEILEVYSGYLANTLSFMRVAGLGIAHVSLMTAFFQIADMISPDGSLSVGGILVIILGNILVIALEGLSAAIQSLRLNYYEFFSKYFNGSGKAYNPVSLNSRS